jgi:hypothetical protein
LNAVAPLAAMTWFWVLALGPAVQFAFSALLFLTGVKARGMTRPGIPLVPSAATQHEPGCWARQRRVGMRRRATSLGQMLRAGLPVPAGIVLTTHALERYLDCNGLRARIEAIERRLGADDPVAAEQIETRVRALFAATPLPHELRATLTRAMAVLPGEGPLAVRSSALGETVRRHPTPDCSTRSLVSTETRGRCGDQAYPRRAGRRVVACARAWLFPHDDGRDCPGTGRCGPRGRDIHAQPEPGHADDDVRASGLRTSCGGRDYAGAHRDRPHDSLRRLLRCPRG